MLPRHRREPTEWGWDPGFRERASLKKGVEMITTQHPNVTDPTSALAAAS